MFAQTLDSELANIDPPDEWNLRKMHNVTYNDS